MSDDEMEEIEIEMTEEHVSFIQGIADREGISFNDAVVNILKEQLGYMDEEETT